MRVCCNTHMCWGGQSLVLRASGWGTQHPPTGVSKVPSTCYETSSSSRDSSWALKLQPRLFVSGKRTDGEELEQVFSRVGCLSLFQLPQQNTIDLGD